MGTYWTSPKPEWLETWPYRAPVWTLCKEWTIWKYIKAQPEAIPQWEHFPQAWKLGEDIVPVGWIQGPSLSTFDAVLTRILDGNLGLNASQGGCSYIHTVCMLCIGKRVEPTSLRSSATFSLAEMKWLVPTLTTKEAKNIFCTVHVPRDKIYSQEKKGKCLMGS